MTRKQAEKSKAKIAPPTPERSAVMRAVKGKNTTPEKLVRSALHRQGFRFRIHNKNMPGKPDIVLPKYKTVIRVMGCFWHGHKCPRGNRTPKTNTEYWTTKIQRNVERDKKQKQELENGGWRVFDVWECNLKEENWIKALVSNLRK
ncbi:MAG: DNA mismatch endonuclease Vsr [Alphaproteobacteria bacterium]|nr:DNA mismatch endonuclease Vsr [Alphaproteobacteria bacterium]